MRRPRLALLAAAAAFLACAAWGLALGARLLGLAGQAADPGGARAVAAACLAAAAVSLAAAPVLAARAFGAGRPRPGVRLHPGARRARLHAGSRVNARRWPGRGEPRRARVRRR